MPIWRVRNVQLTVVESLWSAVMPRFFNIWLIGSTPSGPDLRALAFLLMMLATVGRWWCGSVVLCCCFLSRFHWLP